jgi:hypothetical protein
MGGETKIMQMDHALNKFDELETRLMEINLALSQQAAKEVDNDINQNEEDQQIHSESA